MLVKFRLIEDILFIFRIKYKINYKANNMNRLFGTAQEQPAEAKPQQAPPQQQAQPNLAQTGPKVDLYAQTQKMDNRINDMHSKIKELDVQIKELYGKARSSRGSEQKYVKQRLLQLLKKKKAYEGQMGHYYNSQNALDNVAFTNENIANTLDMCQVLKETNEIQAKQMQKMDMDQMADIMDQQREMQMDAEMINEEMNAHMDNDYDEDDLDMELAEIENDMQLQNAMGTQPQQNQQSNQVNDPFLNNLNNI